MAVADSREDVSASGAPCRASGSDRGCTRLARSPGISGYVRNDRRRRHDRRLRRPGDARPLRRSARRPSIRRAHPVPRRHRRSRRSALLTRSTSWIVSRPASEPCRSRRTWRPVHECVAEIFDPSNRRYRYRSPTARTAVRGSRSPPTSRTTAAATTMAPFVMCAACRARIPRLGRSAISRAAERVSGLRSASDASRARRCSHSRGRRYRTVAAQRLRDGPDRGGQGHWRISSCL